MVFVFKERENVSLAFPGPPTFYRVARQPVHLGYLIQKNIHSQYSLRLRKSTDVNKFFFFLSSVSEWKEARVKCHVIGFSGSDMMGPRWMDSCVFHLQAPGGAPLEWACLANAGHSVPGEEENRRPPANGHSSPTKMATWGRKGSCHALVPWLTTPRKGRHAFYHLLLQICTYSGRQPKFIHYIFSLNNRGRWEQSEDYLTLDPIPLVQSLAY